MDDLFSWQKIASAVLVAVLVAIPTAFLTVYLAFKRYKSEKWWDRKAQCYFETIEALNKIMEACDANIEARSNSSVVCGVEELNEKYVKGKAFFITQTNIGRLLLSKKAYDALIAFDHELSRMEQEADEGRRIAGIRGAAEKCIDTLIPIARKDLGAN